MPKLFSRIFSPESLVKEEMRLGPIPTAKEAYGEAMHIALPSVCEMVFLSLIGMMDTLMVSQLGPYAISAVGLTNQPRMLMLAIFFALNVGVTAIVARRKGEERQEDAQHCLRQSIVLISILAIVMSVISFFVARPLMELAGAKEDTVDPATQYFMIISVGFIVNALSMAICAALRGIGNTRVTMKVNIVANVVNVVFNYLLIEGHFGFPRLEVAGAAVATVIGQVVGLVLALVAVFKKDSYLHLGFRDNWRLEKEMVGSLVRVGGNAALEQVAMRIGFFLTTRIVADLGTVNFAVHQICMQILSLSFNFGDGIGTATTSLVGQNLGRKRPDLSILFGKIGQRMAITVSVALIIAMVAGRYFFISLFSNDPEIIARGAFIMVVMAAIMPIQMSQVVVAGSLRGAGDTRFVANTMLLTVMVIRPLMTYLCIYPFSMGLVGAWAAMAVDQLVRLFMVYKRFAGGRWSQIKL